MRTGPSDLSALVAIQEVQNRYAVAIDDRRWKLLESCFTADADIDYGRVGRFHTAADFVRWADRFHTPLGYTLHQMSSHVAEVDGDTATASCYGHAVLTRFPDGSPDSPSYHTYSRYLDTLARADAGWKIVQRRHLSVLREPAHDTRR